MDNYAEKLFKSMEDKNSRSYDAMILALLKHNYHERAFELFEDMREQNFQASIYTYNGLINKSYVFYGYGEKLWSAVLNLIEHMKQEPVVLPDLYTYNEILKLCALIPNGSDKALEVFRDMCSKGIEPSLATFSRVLRAEYYRDRSMALYENDEGDLKLKQNTNNSVLQAIISHLETYDKLPGLKHSSDIKFFNTAMGSALFCQDANAAHRLYALAETNDKTLLGQKRGLFYATFLVTLAQSEKSAEIVYHMYKELVPAKLIPQSWVYSELFRMVEREKMPRLVPKLYQDMKRYRVPINEQTCRGIFSALARRTSPKNHKQYIEIMTDVFFWMKKFNIPISPYMIGQLVRQYCAGGHLKQAWKAMEMFDEYNFHPTYVALMQLLECCSVNKDREQAMKVFEILAKYGYVISKRKQSSIFDNTQMPLSHRLYINGLFKNAEELDKRRAKYNMPKQPEVSKNEEMENL
ncbi:pentatricopeptide repeat domain-containing protein 3, mitochondrial-like isoform X2 [Actinia tenebrosa]|uniref:Small ribosomal subunit protein mS39 n=1 Tax=Actinia tenebrosa TaxID=6105 RepID=A0A6P8IK13_ACTTE|nr:pentatricopeptide repeat domain-containing protein 3, mitochondrial-like isoform X2 [Actinia tenebrosa]